MLKNFIFRRSFGPTLFLGLFLDAFLMRYLIPADVFQLKYTFIRLLPAALLNGFLCFVLVRFTAVLFNRFKILHHLFGVPEKTDIKLSFFTGFLAVLMRLWPLAFITGVFIVVLAVSQIHTFIRQMRYFLVPNRYITHHDVIKFFIFFTEVVILFTLINLVFSVVSNPVVTASEDILTGRMVVIETHHLINSLYFTIILMTTVGFGDFIPLTFSAKMIVVLECMTSYVMLALMIGLITRGIRSEHPKIRLTRHNSLFQTRHHQKIQPMRVKNKKKLKKELV